MLYRKKPIIIEATQWFKDGDHKAVTVMSTVHGLNHCGYCDTQLEGHGWIETLEGGHIVCKGDYIITGIHGEHYPCKPDIFAKTYEPWPEGDEWL